MSKSSRWIGGLAVAVLIVGAGTGAAWGKPGLRTRTRFANVERIDGARPVGRADWWGSGEAGGKSKDKSKARLFIKLKRVPDASVRIEACGVVYADVVITGKSTKLKLDSKKGDIVPDCSPDATIRVTGASGLDMTGTFLRKY